ncbi:hypothetical protein QBC44DRAFT_335818 [Cladorrhinum sp. PSN332]|nr:hypothetical protein QBC44DRAFT_335818 [Cladorrhinum sp. PSN332]
MGLGSNDGIFFMTLISFLSFFLFFLSLFFLSPFFTSFVYGRTSSRHSEGLYFGTLFFFSFCNDWNTLFSFFFLSGFLFIIIVPSKFFFFRNSLLLHTKFGQVLCMVCHFHAMLRWGIFVCAHLFIHSSSLTNWHSLCFGAEPTSFWKNTQ